MHDDAVVTIHYRTIINPPMRRQTLDNHNPTAPKEAHVVRRVSLLLVHIIIIAIITLLGHYFSRIFVIIQNDEYCSEAPNDELTVDNSAVANDSTAARIAVLSSLFITFNS